MTKYSQVDDDPPNKTTRIHGSQFSWLLDRCNIDQHDYIGQLTVCRYPPGFPGATSLGSMLWSQTTLVPNLPCNR
jgi:hypothetical protein